MILPIGQMLWPETTGNSFQNCFLFGKYGNCQRIISGWIVLLVSLSVCTLVSSLPACFMHLLAACFLHVFCGDMCAGTWHSYKPTSLTWNARQYLCNDPRIPQYNRQKNGCSNVKFFYFTFLLNTSSSNLTFRHPSQAFMCRRGLFPLTCFVLLLSTAMHIISMLHI